MVSTRQLWHKFDLFAFQGGIGDGAAATLAAVHASDGLTVARQLWRRLAAGPAPGGALFRAAVALESDALTAGTPGADVSAAVAAVEAGLRSYGAEDTKLWLQFAKLAGSCHSRKRQRADMALGGIPSVADVAWRAERTLAAPEEFRKLVKDV